MKNIFLLFTISIATLQSFAQPTEFVWNIITFEEPYEYLAIDSSSQNIWQIGEPDKVLFNSAFSLNNAIVTDTLNYYPANNNSYFDLKIGVFNYNTFYPYDIFIEIKHKFNTDTLKDGGFITVSYDQGLTWTNIINDTSGFFDVTPDFNGIGGENIYTENDTLFNGEFGFSGNSDDWLTTWFSWFIYPVKNNMEFMGDTIIIRFNFISDNIETNKEGWMIDNIKLYSIEMGSGIDDTKPLEFRISPNPMNETTIIELKDYGVVELNILDIQGRIVKQNKYFNNQSIIINRDKLNSGIYIVKIKTDKNLSEIRKLIIK